MEKQLFEDCKHGNLMSIKNILETNNIDICVQDNKIFRTVCDKGYYDIVKYLIEYGEIHNCSIDKFITSNTILSRICVLGHIKILKYLIGYAETKNIYISN